jgi:hypothetical protein
MSLKAFHVFFLLVSILILAFFGVWGILNYQESKSVVNLALGLAALPMSAVLAWYFNWFLKKLKNVSYL